MQKGFKQIRLDLSKTPFNLDYTLSCGQVFRWQKLGAHWFGIVGVTVVKINQTGETLHFRSYPNEVDTAFVWDYFRLDDDLPFIYSRIRKDKYVDAAVKRFYGLRLIRQDPWECLISYICATNKNIPAIIEMISNVCRRFGKKVQAKEDAEVYLFPTPDNLADASLRELKLCKLGYRARYVKTASKLVSSNALNLEILKTLPYEAAKRELMKVPGVGPKVADCVLLFSLDKLEAFPIDVWMKRIVLDSYANHFEPLFVDKARLTKSPSPQEYRVIGAFGRSYFGAYVGYAQEYLYHYRKCQP